MSTVCNSFFAFCIHCYMLDFSTVHKIHFLGIGGVSISSLARFFFDKNYEISGSDREHSVTLDTLAELGIRVWTGFEPQLIGSPDLVVYSSAIKKDNPELAYCIASGFTCVERLVLLSHLCKLFEYTVAIAGTHGKTTVTSMCATVFDRAMIPHYAHIGGMSNEFGNYLYTGDRYLLIEACEYKKSLLALSPSVSVILNAELDHPDTYKTKSELYDTFDTFFDNTNKGLKILNGDDDYYLHRQRLKDVITFGFGKDNHYKAENIFKTKNGCLGCTMSYCGIPLFDIELSVPGKHNLINALATTCICHSIGIETSIIKNGLISYQGVKRRFEKVGIFCGCDVYLDYAHHPTEILTAINTAREITKSKLWVVFQPHTYSRTLALKESFIEALSNSDNLVILTEYASREKEEDGISAYALYNSCTNRERYFCKSIIEVATLLTKKTAPNECILVLGAGDVINLTKILI